MKQLARAEAKLLREKLKADQADDRAIRQAARKAVSRLQKVRKATQNSRRKHLKASIEAASKEKVVVKAQGSDEPQGSTPRSPPAQSRRGRNINLPAKYI
jgi:hypothetical protein